MSKEEKPLYVTELFVENFVKISALTIVPTGPMVQITGKNGQGKSSTLDAMWAALAGAAAAPAKPIKTGAEKATIKLSLGDIIVTRTFTRKKHKNDKDEVISEEVTTDVKVESAEGARFPRAQTVLDTFYDELTLDPTEFERLPDKGKFDVMKKFVSEFDFDTEAGKTVKDMADRKDINKRLTETLAAASQISLPDNVPDEPLDESALITEMETAGTKNVEIEQRKNRREAAAVRIVEIDRMAVAAAAFRDQTMTRAQQRCAEIMAEAETAINNSRESEAILAEEKKKIEVNLANAEPLPEMVDTTALRRRIEEARAMNVQVALKKRRHELSTLAREMDEKSKALTLGMKKREETKQAAIKAAKLPVEGLGFGDDMILYNEEPFSQASQAERIRVSSAIAMASNPRLRVIRLKHGNDLDDDSMKVLMDMCVVNNFQCWVERINATGPMGFVIENGALKEPETKDEGKLL